MRVIPLLRIPPGALLAVNPKLFLQAKSVTQITKDDWHAFYDRIESQIRRTQRMIRKERVLDL